MINFHPLYGIFIIFDQTSTRKQKKSCEVCIVDSFCTDDTIYFNISISKHCQNPLKTAIALYTDVDLKHRYFNKIITCNNCYINILIESAHDAWDCTLRLESPEPSKTCSTQHTAHCEGTISYLIWFITGCLSALFIILGGLVCCIKHECNQKTSCSSKKQEVKVETVDI
ncbi:unnamed protein product [Rotaria sp. Silwood2]|nr:unnamed protein product [Rotaria sp. Silwood2]CAF2758536.1 unnamed protein product [Rotaria sp. Silwood2]CAF2928657.1 unnamed protein product [Rotaria sp. Silwood2]CAF3945953.1 unnamed protein product [Rotaria sp. Silwood2]CAF4035372.1 unnamed protein product [Rotaria sp. Silwood2]